MTCLIPWGSQLFCRMINTYFILIDLQVVRVWNSLVADLKTQILDTFAGVNMGLQPKVGVEVDFLFHYSCSKVICSDEILHRN